MIEVVHHVLLSGAICLLHIPGSSAGSQTFPAADLVRARQRVPRDGWKGDTFERMNTLLTSRLRASGHEVISCSLWSIAELQQLQRRIFKEAERELLAVYAKVGDNRRQRFGTLETLESHWSDLDRAAAVDDDFAAIRRDGLCHETVMWWVHHLSTPIQRRLVAEGIVLPSLPTTEHVAGQDHGSSALAVNRAHQVVHAEYAHQVSCQQCHTGTIGEPQWKNATLPKPLPMDKTHPGRERQRACDYQNDPPCGPCEGLGGRRWGDDPESMTPIVCEVIHGPEVSPTTRGRYPDLATVHLTGETRTPIEVVPVVPGKYVNITGELSLGWQGETMRMRYDFDGSGAQVSAQTSEQARKQDVGATIHEGGGQCACTASIAGIMHVQSFEAADPLDPLKLPAADGGAAYLGRVRVVLDGDTESSRRTAIADHFMKWVFHFLVDAEVGSPSFGLPLRLYGATGVRQVFDSWRRGDPSTNRPDMWKLPAGCKVMALACSVFNATGVVAIEGDDAQLVI